MRTLVATILKNSKKKDVYCSATKVSSKDLTVIKSLNREELENMGFEFVRIISLEYSEVRGYVLFYNGHLDEMSRSLKNVRKSFLFEEEGF